MCQCGHGLNPDNKKPALGGLVKKFNYKFTLIKAYAYIFLSKLLQITNARVTAMQVKQIRTVPIRISPAAVISCCKIISIS